MSLLSIKSFFSSDESACVGVALGRRGLWAAQTLGLPGQSRVLWCEKIELKHLLFSGKPSAGVEVELVEVFTGLLKKTKNNYSVFQIALPDPAAFWEIFELEQAPASAKATQEFLNWRVSQSAGKTAPDFLFASQNMGLDQQKNLLLGLGFERIWLEVIQKASRLAGIRASVTDSASHYRFNVFQDAIEAQKGGGALLTFEPEYWNLLLWDEEKRLRLARSKWWNKPVLKWKDIPLEETLLEVERTIRSYLSSHKNHSVENLFLLSSDDWESPIAGVVKKHTDGRSSSLSWKGVLSAKPKAASGILTPSVVAAAVRR